LKEFGGFGLIAASFSQRLDNICFFKVFQMGGQIYARVGKVKFRAYSLRIVIGNMVWQLFGLDFVGPLKRDGTFHGML
jgi:hypothetical protein